MKETAAATRPPTATAKGLAIAVITAVAMGLGAGLAESPALTPIRLTALNLQHLLHRDPAFRDRRILIVAVDQRSLDYFDRDNVPFPWPRTLYKPLVQYATMGGAKAILFDLLFNNQSPFGPDIDREFADAVAASGKVYLAAAVSRGGSAGGKAPAALGLRFRGTPPDALSRATVSLPVEPISSAAAGVAFVTQGPDEDGVYRSALPFVVLGGRLLPALGLAALVGKRSEVRWGNEDGMSLDGRRLPVDSAGRLLLRFRGGGEQFERLSAVDVIRSAVMHSKGETPPIAPEVFRNRYVFVAYTAPGLLDFKPTPVSAVTPGAFVQATLLSNALDKDFLRLAAGAWNLLLTGLVTLAAVASTVLVQRSSVSSLLSAGALSGGLAATQLGFRQGMVWDVTLLIVCALSGLILASAYRYHSEGRRRRFLQSAFSHYVSPQVVQRIIQSPHGLELGGEKRDITVLFADLAGFTTLAERLEPQALVAMLNDYTSQMTEVILARQGTVDKFIGDAVMAFWGAPVDQAQQSELAVAAALECQQRFAAYVASRYPDLPLAVRIGIDRGECIVGNMGSRERFDYTAIGDTVNQASRLEGLNKAYGSRMLIGESAWEPVRERFVGRQIDYLKVKGKSHAVRVYEPLAPKDLATPQQIDLCRHYQAAFRAYQERAWDEAERVLQEMPQLGGDPPAQALMARVRHFRLNPPAEDWDGAFIHVSK
jgi:adenylate cyclase